MPIATQLFEPGLKHLSLFLQDLSHQVKLRSDKNLCRYRQLVLHGDPSLRI